MAVTTFTRSSAIIDKTEGGGLVQDAVDIIGTGTGECLLQGAGTFVTIGTTLYNVPSASSISGIDVSFQSKYATSTQIIEVTASIGDETQSTAIGVTNTSYVTYTPSFTFDPSKVKYNNVNNLTLTFRKQSGTGVLYINGDTGGGSTPVSRVEYTPLRWARVLTSGSNFPVTTLTNSTFNVVPSNVGFYSTTFTNNQGHLKVTSSIAFQNAPSQPIFYVGRATINSQSLFISSSTISASNIPNEISIPDTGDFRSDVLWHKIQDGILPKGRIAKNSTIAVENVLTYTGSKVASNNANLLSGSTAAPFIPTAGNRTVDGFSLPGDVIGFTGVNSGDVGYADYSNQNLIRIERTSPQRGEDDDLKFFVTASFAIPYSSSFTSNAGLKAYVVRVQLDQDDRFIAEAGNLEIGGLSGEGGPIGMFTGSVVIPSSRTDLLIENERIELRIQNKGVGRPVQVGFTGSGATAIFELKDEFDANLKPSFYFDVSLESTFVGEAWSAYSGSLYGVSLNDIPASQGITRGPGLLFTTSSATNISDPVGLWYGQKEATASIRLSPANTRGNMLSGENTSGLTFSTFTNPTNQAQLTAIINGAANLYNLANSFPALALTASIADGDGLSLNDSNKLNIIDLNVVGSNSGLSLGVSGLKISGFFDHEGLENTGGVLKIVTASQGGLELTSELALTSSLAGTGLNFNNVLNDRSAINVDYTYVITGSAALTASVPSVGVNPTGPLFVGNDTPQASIATSSIQYSSSTDLNILTYQYGFSTAMFHTSLSSISGSTLRINGDVNLGNKDNLTDHVHLSSSAILLSSSFPSLNRTTFGHGAPQSYKRGGLIISNNTSTTDNTGSAIFFDKGVQGNPFTNWDFQDLDSSGWMLTTASSVIKQGANTNPFSPLNVNSNPTSSFEHNDFVAHIQTVKSLSSTTFATTDPNTISETSSLYQTSSISNYGAICVMNLSSPSDDSNVWMYVPESSV